MHKIQIKLLFKTFIIIDIVINKYKYIVFV